MGYKSKKRHLEKATTPTRGDADGDGGGGAGASGSGMPAGPYSHASAGVSTQGSEAESAGSEGSNNDEKGGGQKPRRERPAGLSYKLREETTRATVRKLIGRKTEQLEAWLTHAVVDDDSWQSEYAEGGQGAQFGAPSGGDGGAEQQQPQGDVDEH
eukprot:jgi/Tetstr1/440053/TSEL_028412.t1